jgi:hypothetical protein
MEIMTYGDIVEAAIAKRESDAKAMAVARSSIPAIAAAIARRVQSPQDAYAIGKLDGDTFVANAFDPFGDRGLTFTMLFKFAAPGGELLFEKHFTFCVIANAAHLMVSVAAGGPASEISYEPELNGAQLDEAGGVIDVAWSEALAEWAKKL